MADLMAQLKTQAVGEWEMVGECFFTREPLYDMSWGDDFELEDKRLTCAPFGGPIAAIRDERRTVLVTHGSSAVAAGGGLKPLLRTFTSAGESLGACLWEGGRLVAWGWTEEQQLAIVEATGKVSLFSPFAEKIREFSFGAVVEKDGVAAAEVYGSGVVVVTEPRQPAAPPGAAAAAADVTPSECCEIWVVSNVRDPKPIRLKSPSKEAYRAAAAAAAAAAGTGARGSGPLPGVITGLGGLGRPWLPQCLAVLDPRVTLSRGVEVLAVVGGSLWQLDEASATDHYPLALRAAGSAVHLAVSPDGSFIALYTSDDRLLVLSADLNRQLTEFETRGADFAPTGLYWVGSDAVLLTWPDAAVLVGAFGDSVQWSFSEDLTAVIPEVDGCRLIMGRTAQQLLRKVPESCVEVFRPGATGPAAQLWDARTLYDDQNPRCDRILRSIQDLSPASLSAAVATCIQAAGHDLNPVRQRALMRAAAYGRPFCPPDFPRQLMYGVACRLRILNAARDPRVGLPLTMTQLEALSLPVLVARLISYRQWLLAYRVAEVLKNIPGGLAVAAFPPSAAAAELSGLQFRAALAAEEQQTDPAPAATKLASTLADVAQKYGQSKECAFQSKAVAEMGSLLREQVKLERETGQRLFVGLSLVDTLRTAIRLGHHKAATALKKQFSVTDRRLTWIKVRTLAEARDWESLEGFATELRRNPIGWEPFVEAAKKWNAPQDYTARLVARLPDSPSKAEEYSALGLAKDAAEVAARIKDSDLFARIQSAVAAGSPAAAAIAQIKDRFQSAFR
ncbi:hypothetical protein Vafri_18928 [Volvox africanus]|uniref:Protein VACUOLELESS1 n=1 Tax=Volvox africanus TaxID=51714 RepID=A0A8J4BNE0_9CHLO|nr:hypothetical protein Vafri_18928 [Volvox africanus]